MQSNTLEKIKFGEWIFNSKWLRWELYVTEKRFVTILCADGKWHVAKNEYTRSEVLTNDKDIKTMFDAKLFAEREVIPLMIESAIRDDGHFKRNYE